ncbi:S1 family peptidase [Jatrophihabitans fulvus]
MPVNPTTSPFAAVLVDVAVIAVVVLAAVRGYRRGGLASLVRLGGGVAGLAMGLVVAGLLSAALPPVAHVLLGVACALGGVLLGLSLGRRLAAPLARHRPLLPDRLAGAVVGGAVGALVCGLLASVAVAAGPPALAAAVRAGSVAPDSPDDVPVAGEVWHGVGGMLQEVAPSDLAALVPSVGDAAPSATVIDAVERRVRMSVLRVTASGCTGGVTGTGFVAGTDGDAAIVVTNAHVAGGGGARVADRPATVVYLNRRADLAVLRVPSLSAAPLPLARTDAANGDGLVVVGYPEGGPRTAVGATVVQRSPVPNPGLADGIALHEAYLLRAPIAHGNSGSPLLDTSGRVVGVVNALTGSSGRYGYAISVDELRGALQTAAGRTTAVPAQSCS